MIKRWSVDEGCVQWGLCAFESVNRLFWVVCVCCRFYFNIQDVGSCESCENNPLSNRCCVYEAWKKILHFQKKEWMQTLEKCPALFFFSFLFWCPALFVFIINKRIITFQDLHDPNPLVVKSNIYLTRTKCIKALTFVLSLPLFVLPPFPAVPFKECSLSALG